MKEKIRVVPVEKLSDRAFAELYGFSVQSYEPREHGLRVVGQSSDVAWYSVGPPKDSSRDVVSEQAAWSLAAKEAKARADQWGANCRNSRIDVVTADFIPLGERPLFGYETDNDRIDVAGVAAKAASDVMAAKNADLVIRSIRLADAKISREVIAKKLPVGREENIALLKKLLGA